MNDKLTQAKYVEWSASLFGASIASFGFGVWFASFFQAYYFGIILIGVVIHAWGMYFIHQRNK